MYCLFGLCRFHEAVIFIYIFILRTFAIDTPAGVQLPASVRPPLVFAKLRFYLAQQGRCAKSKFSEKRGGVTLKQLGGAIYSTESASMAGWAFNRITDHEKIQA